MVCGNFSTLVEFIFWKIQLHFPPLALSRTKISTKLAQSWHKADVYHFLPPPIPPAPSFCRFSNWEGVGVGRGRFPNKWWQKGGVRKRGNVPEGRSSGARKRDLGGNNVGTGLEADSCVLGREVDILIFCLYGNII